MDPELVDGVEILMDDELYRMHDDGGGHVEELREVRLQCRLTQCRGQIVVLRAVMHHVLGPGSD